MQQLDDLQHAFISSGWLKSKCDMFNEENMLLSCIAVLHGSASCAISRIISVLAVLCHSNMVTCLCMIQPDVTKDCDCQGN